ncbi:hypothetical protein WAF17_13265 [Bernardetia sp. ABR2-2B]|uniref:hypothetical protein n=1 Tax=Bernardetia sp. ABR2-2B TaxID=3127472 RepID=UPI0030D1B766
MLHTHYLDTNSHSDFLKQERIDPITGEKIEEGHTIVICAACKSAFFVESWEYLGNEHCNQEETLSEIPTVKSLQLVAKPLEYLPFLFRKGSYFAKEGKEGNWELIKNSIIFILGGLISTFLLIFFVILIGVKTSPIYGVIFLGVVLSLVGIIVNLYRNKKSFIGKDNPKKATYVALDLKNQSINYKKKDRKNIINFAQVRVLKYSLKYISSQICRKEDSYILSLEINTKQYQKIRFHTILHKNEIPHWSKFLEELPYTIPVLNQK